MEEVQRVLDDDGFGHFYVMENREQLGEMEVRILATNLTVYHTEVSEKAKGKGYVQWLLKEMTGYARKNKLNVIPLCPYVHAQFRRHPDEYADVWKKE